jgi:hypothetical protein
MVFCLGDSAYNGKQVSNVFSLKLSSCFFFLKLFKMYTFWGNRLE